MSETSRPTSDVAIVMYHSIAEGRLPLCTAPARFREQLTVLEDNGYRTVSVAEYDAWRRGERNIPGRCVVLTFDDGYTNFFSEAMPAIVERGWSGTVYLPADLIGSEGAIRVRGAPMGPFMSWEMATEAAAAGIELGAHGMGHADLTRLSPEAAALEIRDSGETIQERAGCEVTTFAPPFGSSNQRIREQIARRYTCSVGTIMDLATVDSDRYDLPRIDMCYFHRLERWRDFVEGDMRYFARRRRIRRIREALTGGR